MPRITLNTLIPLYFNQIFTIFIVFIVFVKGSDDQILAICGNGAQELLQTEAEDADTTVPMAGLPTRRDHVAVLSDTAASTDDARFQRARNQLTVKLFDNQTNLYQPVRCTLRIESCPSCLLKIKYAAPAQFMDSKEAKMMQSCFESSVDPCFELKFVEEKADTALDLIYQKITVWDDPDRSEWTSSGDSIVLVVTLWNIDSNSTLNDYIQALFPLSVQSISNAEVVRGHPSENVLLSNQTSVGYIQSPRYPAAYPRSLIKDFTLINEDPKGFVRLIFDDFHVHFQSEMQILDSDGSLLVTTRDSNRRPPALISKGPTMTIKFDAKDFTQVVGFRARYEFVDDHDWPEKPNSRNCDEHFEGYGGDIKLDREGHLMNSYVDCIWIVGRFPHISRTFDRIHLKIEEFHLKGVGLRLEVREGPSSTSDRILLLFDTQTRDQLEHKQPRHGFSTSLSTPAYYIRLRGFLMNTSGFEVVYSQFYRWATSICPGIGEFHCDNARCIKSTLRCDGINHCGDGSDEQCQRPVSDFKPPDGDVSGLLALVVGLCALLILIFATSFIVGKLYRKRQQDPETATTTFPSETNSGPSIQTVGERRFYVLPENQISVIEAPPSYDDAMKHPAVPITHRGPGYINEGFMPSYLQNDHHQLSPREPPPILEELDIDQPSCSGINRATSPVMLPSPPLPGTGIRLPNPTVHPVANVRSQTMPRPQSSIIQIRSEAEEAVPQTNSLPRSRRLNSTPRPHNDTPVVMPRRVINRREVMSDCSDDEDDGRVGRPPARANSALGITRSRSAARNDESWV